jgi:hypothetical protein
MSKSESLLESLATAQARKAEANRAVVSLYSECFPLCIYWAETAMALNKHAPSPGTCLTRKCLLPHKSEYLAGRKKDGYFSLTPDEKSADSTSTIILANIYYLINHRHITYVLYIFNPIAFLTFQKQQKTTQKI